MRDTVRNTDIKEQCETQDIVKWRPQRRRQWYDHILRMDVNRLPKIALKGNPPDLRPSPKRWRDSWHSTSQEDTLFLNERVLMARDSVHFSEGWSQDIFSRCQEIRHVHSVHLYIYTNTLIYNYTT